MKRSAVAGALVVPAVSPYAGVGFGVPGSEQLSGGADDARHARRGVVNPPVFPPIGLTEIPYKNSAVGAHR